MTAAEAARAWLDAELRRVWLAAELRLRQLQRAGLRPPPSHASQAEIEAMLLARRAGRGRADGAELDALAQAAAEAARDVRPARQAAPLGRLARNLGVTELEVEALAMALAPHVDPVLVELLDVLDPQRPLVAWRLIQVAPLEGAEAYGSMAHRAMQPTVDALALLRGREGPSPGVQRHARLLVRAPSLAGLTLGPEPRAELERLCRAAHADPAAAPATWTVLWGPAGAGKREVAARLAACAGQALLAVDVAACEKALREDLLRRAQRDALVLGAALYVGPLVADAAGGEVAELVRRLDDHPGTLFLGVEGSRAPRLRIEHAVRELALGVPPEAERLALWRGALDGGGVDLAALARGFLLTPGEILDTADEAKRLARGQQRPVELADVRRGVERRLRNGLGDLAWRIEVKVKWEDLVLKPEELERVEEFLARSLFAGRVYGEWGLGERVERGRGLIALFSGPPGTGKTMLAGLVATSLGLDLYQVDLSQIHSRWVGETEKQMARLFDLAERAHAVLLFDEADALLSRRTDVESSNDRYANAAVNYLLQRLEQYSGIAVLTTNKDAALDEALQRRLSLHLRLDVPEQAERERLWRSLLPDSVPLAGDVDFAVLAREFELTGGYIKNVVLRAAFLAARQERAIDLELFRRAARLELEDMGHLVFQRDEVVDDAADEDWPGGAADFLDG